MMSAFPLVGLATCLQLRSGRALSLSQPRLPGLSDYYVLALGETAPSDDELDEASVVAHHVGRELALRRHGDAECYSLIYNAGRTRRRPWPHFHILLARSTLEKRRAFLLLQMKHVLRWLARPALPRRRAC
jgi:hypothetical protein